MKNQQSESLQNRFSAYLVAAVTNKRIPFATRISMKGGAGVTMAASIVVKYLNLS